MKRIVYLLATLLSISVLNSGCQHSPKYIFTEGMVWNTTYHITYEADKDMSDSIKKVLEDVGKSLSVFDTMSNVSRINRNETVKADAMLRQIYLTSKKIWKESDGYFDPTLSPLITAWGFGKGHQRDSNFNVEEILGYVGLEKTELQGDSIIKKDRRIEFNFSAIAKGYGCDRVGEMFKRNRIKNYLVEIGGEIALAGKNSRGEDWNISIDKPIASIEETHSSELVVSLTNCGVATSGNYRNFYNNADERYGHTIDPKTGRPATTDILSATLICNNTMEADAYATACMAMGYERAKQMIETYHLAAFLIINETTTWTSKEFKKYLK